jgi:hypothetical protein
MNTNLLCKCNVGLKVRNFQIAREANSYIRYIIRRLTDRQVKRSSLAEHSPGNKTTIHHSMNIPRSIETTIHHSRNIPPALKQAFITR